MRFEILEPVPQRLLEEFLASRLRFAPNVTPIWERCFVIPTKP